MKFSHFADKLKLLLMPNTFKGGRTMPNITIHDAIQHKYIHYDGAKHINTLLNDTQHNNTFPSDIQHKGKITTLGVSFILLCWTSLRRMSVC